MREVIKKYYDAVCHWWVASELSPWADFVAPALSLVGIVLTVDFQNLWREHPYRLIIASCLFVLAILVAVLNILCQPTIKALCKENKSLKLKNENLESQNGVIAQAIKNVFEGFLYQLSQKLEFGSRKTNCERVTIYIHSSKIGGSKIPGLSDGHFIPFGRYSANPRYSQLGRPQYPENEGCIAKGWEDTWCFENQLGEDDDAYKRKSYEEYNLSKETLDKIKMKSKLYAVQRIDKEKEKLAVLVVESLHADRFDEQDIKSKLEQEAGYIVQLIDQFKDHIPYPDNEKVFNARRRES